MSRLFPKTVLITQGELINFAGSEIVTLELAEYFSSKGSLVHVLSNYIGAPIKEEFQKLKNVVLHTSSEGIEFKSLDLVWIHHQLIPQELLELADTGLLRAKVVFHHMSSYHPLEFPFAAKIEQYLADLVLFNSHESKEAIEGRLNELDLRGEVFNNPAPDYFQLSGKRYRGKIKKILVVSNHVPDELSDAIDILKKQDIEVRNFGLAAQQVYKRITPKDLAWADVVITIGKTVQYAIQSGVPVYCYDHFGGCGYFTDDNFQKAAQLNFSGRGFAQKSAETIADELIGLYQNAVTYSRQLHKSAGSEYLLSNKLSSVLNAVQATRASSNKRLSQADRAAFEAISKHLWSVHGRFCGVSTAYQELSSRHANLSNEYSQLVANLEDEISSLREQLRNVLNSKSWKITEPLRRANKKVKGARDDHPFF